MLGRRRCRAPGPTTAQARFATPKARAAAWMLALLCQCGARVPSCRRRCVGRWARRHGQGNMAGPAAIRAQHTAAWTQLRPHSTIAVLPASPRSHPTCHGPMCHQRRGGATTGSLKPGHGRMGGALAGWPPGSRPSPHAQQCRWPGPHPSCPDTATAAATATAIAASARCTAWRPLSRPWAWRSAAGPVRAAVVCYKGPRMGKRASRVAGMSGGAGGLASGWRSAAGGYTLTLTFIPPDHRQSSRSRCQRADGPWILGDTRWRGGGWAMPIRARGMRAAEAAAGLCVGSGVGSRRGQSGRRRPRPGSGHAHVSGHSARRGEGRQRCVVLAVRATVAISRPRSRWGGARTLGETRWRCGGLGAREVRVGRARAKAGGAWPLRASPSLGAFPAPTHGRQACF